MRIGQEFAAIPLAEVKESRVDDFFESRAMTPVID